MKNGFRIIGDRKYKLIAGGFRPVTDEEMELQENRLNYLGKKKYKMIFGKMKTKRKRMGALESHTERLGRRGMGVTSYLTKRYRITDEASFLRIQTKRISGVISDVVEIGRTV